MLYRVIKSGFAKNEIANIANNGTIPHIKADLFLLANTPMPSIAANANTYNIEKIS
jgi:hypothetical protein